MLSVAKARALDGAWWCVSEAEQAPDLAGAVRLGLRNPYRLNDGYIVENENGQQLRVNWANINALVDWSYLWGINIPWTVGQTLLVVGHLLGVRGVRGPSLVEHLAQRLIADNSVVCEARAAAIHLGVGLTGLADEVYARVSELNGYREGLVVSNAQ